MIIACPACGTRYVVPDTAIGVDGRTVRCAKCRHSWFQDGAAVPAREPPVVAPSSPPRPTPSEAPEGFERSDAAAEPSAAPSPAVDGTAGESPREEDASFSFERSAPEAAAGTVVRARVSAPGEAHLEAPSSFEHEPPFRPRRNKAKLWTIAAVSFALFVGALVGAAWWFGLPDWLPLSRPTFGVARAELELSFPRARQDRRTLPNGTEYFGASGTVTNVGKDLAKVPPILIVMRDAQNRVVYHCDIAAPTKPLSPGDSVTINQACLDVPRSAKIAEIGWKPD